MLTNHEQRERKSRIAAIAGTILVHALILISLILLALHTRVPLSGNDGVEVSFNYNTDSLADNQPQVQALAQDSLSQPVQSVSEEKPVTKKDDESAGIDKNKKKTVKPENAQGEKPAVIIETPLERTIIRKPGTPVRSTKTSTTPNQSVTVKPTEGKPADIPSSAKANNNDGKVNGVSFELGGRGSLNLQKPAFNPSFQGKIVVSIIVDKEGKVIYASAKDTATSDIKLRQQAENAARKSLFAPDKNAPAEQRGTITYVFVK